MSKSDNKIKYGKYDLIKPFTVLPLKLHFENGKPFKHVSRETGKGFRSAVPWALA